MVWMCRGGTVGISDKCFIWSFQRIRKRGRPQRRFMNVIKDLQKRMLG